MMCLFAPRGGQDGDGVVRKPFYSNYEEKPQMSQKRADDEKRIVSKH